MKKMTLILLCAILCTALTVCVTAANNIAVLINGECIQFDVPPQIINNRTMVPMRAIFEAFGATVEWDANTRTVTADTGGRTITMTIGEYRYYINGTETTLDVPAQIVNNRTLVPVRAISEALDCQVGWDGKERIVSIIEDWQNYQMLYADGGRQRAFHVNEVPGQLTVGWFDNAELLENENKPIINSEQSVIEVSNTKELLENIGSNRKLILTSDYYNVYLYSDSINNRHLEEQGFNLKSYVIKNVSNLTITGNATIVIDDIYAAVLSFENCSDIVLQGLTIGHTEGKDYYSCEGAVTEFIDCTDITIDNCSLFGCGAVGIHAYNTSELTVNDSKIYDCTYTGIWLSENSSANVYDSEFFDSVHDDGFIRIDSSRINMNNCSIHDIVCEPFGIFITVLDFFGNESQVVFSDCYFSGNKFESITDSETQNITFNRCTFTDNSGNLEHEAAVYNECGFSALDNTDTGALEMTYSEQQIASSVYWITERSVQYEDAEKCFILLFSLQDYNENYLKAPAVVDVRIENNNGEIVYDGMEFVYTENYSTWSNRFGKSWLAASIKIPVDWITPGTTEYGTIYFTVHNEDYFNFDEFALSLSGDLPTIDLAEGCVLHLPECPISISDEDYRDYLVTLVTDVTYSFEESYGDVELYLYFTGERTDFEPDGYVSKYCSIGWKLYDRDGYVIDSGTATTPALEPGDRFRDVEERIYNLEPGEYWLEILDVVG